MSQMGQFLTTVAGGAVNTLTGDLGGAVGPLVGNINILGGLGDITVTGNPGLNTLWVEITSTTNHSILLGNATGGLASLGIAANGQIPIGSNAANPVLAVPTNGNNITWTAGAGSLRADVTGILPVANGGTGVNSLAIAKTIYVTKSGNDGNTGTDIFHAKLTIQAAVNIAVAGDTILVYPGTYTETVTHAASDISVFAMGDSTNCIIQQADANVIDFNTQTGIVYKFFRIQVTAATTAINTIQGTTGSCIFTDCYLRMISAADIVAATQPSIASITGAGAIYISLGNLDYLHTGNCGGTALKSALLVDTGGLIEVHSNTDANISCSGTAAATALAIDLAATGNINIYTSIVNVTDPDAVLVAGLGYLGGVGTVHEYFRNNVHVTVGAANTGYGFYAGDTVSVSRFFYNHIHVTDAGGSSYGYYIGATATVISHFDDIIAADGISLNPAGFYYEASSEANGDLSLIGPSAAGTRTLTVANTDNTATASNSGVHVSVGGATSTGDPYVNFLVTGAGTYSVGIDNTVANDPFKITTGATPSAGTDLFTMSSTGVITLNNDLDVTEGGTGVSTLTSHGILLGNGAGDIQALTEAADGQIPIGSSGNNPVLATLTAGVGINILEGPGSITISATGGGGGLTWNVVTGATQAMAVNNGHITNRGAGVVYTLPAVAAVGDRIQVTGILGLWTIAQNAGQTVHFGSSSTTTGVGGLLAATHLRNTVELVCVIANTDFNVISSIGSITVT